MQKVTEFLVKRRYWVFAVMMVAAVICGLLAFRVPINTDMTKYLADSSPMKQGMDLMEEEFPDTELTQTIRVMVQGLDKEGRADMLEKLSAIEYVDHVEFEEGSASYQQGDETLYVIHTLYDYQSPEELAIENALASDFSSYDLTYKNDNTATTDIPPLVFLLAMGLLTLVLLLMCASWVEPFLFLFTLGVAIVINLGTNLMLGSVSNITFSIAAILQLVLSMDYSIILMNRYRQESAQLDDRCLAMQRALRHAFSSILSSGMTTVVGLLMLVFMSFRIGLDLGLVLAKGVLISMICVFTVLPGLILLFDKAIRKTAKKVLPVPTRSLASFGSRFRRPIAAGFAILFVAVCFLQSMTQTVYTLSTEDPIADVFTPTNTLVMVYDNEDEEAVAQLASELQKESFTTGVISYPTTLGKDCTVNEMLDFMGDMGGDSSLPLNETTLSLFYYAALAPEELSSLTVADFFTFLQDESDTLEDFDVSFSLESDGESNALLSLLAQPEALTQPKTAEELSGLLSMKKEDLLNLLLYYGTQHGGMPVGTLTLPTFTDFLLNEVAQDPTMSSFFEGDDTLSQLQALSVFTDAEAVTRPLSHTQAGNILGLTSSQSAGLYAWLLADSSNYTPTPMALPTFTSFLQGIQNDPVFSSYLTKEETALIGQLAQYTDPDWITTPLSAQDMTAALQVEKETVQLAYTLYAGYAQENKAPLLDVVTFLSESMKENSLLSGSVSKENLKQLEDALPLMQAAASGQSYGAADLASLLGLSETDVSGILALYAASQAPPVTAMTLPDFLRFITETPELSAALPDETAQELTNLLALVGVAETKAPLSPAQMAAALTLPEATVQQVYQLYGMMNGQPAPETMTLSDFLHFLLETPSLSGALPAETITQLSQMAQLSDLAASGQALSSETLSAVLGMSSEQIEMIFSAYGAAQSSSTPVTMTVSDFLSFLLENPTVSGQLTPENQASLSQAATLAQAAQSGTALSAKELSTLLGVTEEDATLLLALYAGEKAEPITMSPQQLISFLLHTPALSQQLPDNTRAQLSQLQTLMETSTKGTALTPAQMGTLLGMKENDVRLLYALYDVTGENSRYFTFTLEELIDALLQKDALSSFTGSQNQEDLQTAQSLIHHTLNETRFSPNELAKLLSLSEEDAQSLFLLYTSRHGDTGQWQLSVQELLRFLTEEGTSSEELGAYLDDKTLAQLKNVRALVDAAVAGTSFDADAMSGLLQPLSESVTPDTIGLAYLYIGSLRDSDPTWTMTPETLIHTLLDLCETDSRFASVIDEDTRRQIQDAQQELSDGVRQLKGTSHSLFMLTTTLPSESAETSAFVEKLHAFCDEHMEHPVYWIGTSAMNYEMEQNFAHEMMLITLLTALSIFLVVALTFRSVAIPVLLVLIVQGGVYLTMTINGLLGYSMYYLALLIVQCILMGATIDYGILFTNYYREKRQTMEIPQALAASYSHSIHTILTSGLIMILATAAIGLSPVEPTIAQICQTISLGALSATVLILFVLPGLLAACDRFVVKRR